LTELPLLPSQQSTQSKLKMKTLAVVVIGLAFLAVVQAAPCDKQKFQQCSDSLAKDLGITGTADVIILIQKMLDLVLKEGLDGQKKVCTGMKNLKTCLGDQYDSCMSVSYLTSVGIGQEVAIDAVMLAYQQLYVCTTGWDVVSKNWDCLNDVTKKNQDYFKKCLADASAQIAKDPSNACKYIQGYVDCYNDPFKKACVPEVAQVQCESVKVGFAQVLPQCTLNCPGSPISSSSSSPSPSPSPSSTPRSGAAQLTISIFAVIGYFVLSFLHRAAFERK